MRGFWLDPQNWLLRISIPCVNFRVRKHRLKVDICELASTAGRCWLRFPRLSACAPCQKQALRPVAITCTQSTVSRPNSRNLLSTRLMPQVRRPRQFGTSRPQNDRVPDRSADRGTAQIAYRLLHLLLKCDCNWKRALGSGSLKRQPVDRHSRWPTRQLTKIRVIPNCSNDLPRQTL